MKQFKKSIKAIYILLSVSVLLACSTTPSNEKWLDEALDKAEQQALLMAKVMKAKPDRLPRTAEADGTLITSASDWWCSGFFPGVLWYLYENSGNTQIKDYAIEITNRINKEQFNATTHDLGFMLYCSYGNALRLTKADTCKTVLLNGSASLSSRYNPVVKCIKSWEEWYEYKYPVIIDNMMNLEMLMWAYKESGAEMFRDIAVSHANTTMTHHFRADYSSYHVVAYDPETGEVQFQGTDQGFNNTSSWARGQAWGLYGYTMMYRETKDLKYLEQAHCIARFLLNHPRLPEDKIPFWDFDSSRIPDDYRDSSAAAVIASALIELAAYSNETDKKRYLNIAEKQLRTLASPEYTADPGTNGCFILKHGVGNIPQNSEIDAPLSYGDYYYVEALLRYKNMNK